KDKESIRFDDALKLFGLTQDEIDKQIERNPYHAIDKLYSYKINKMRALKEKKLDVQRPTPEETREICEKYKVKPDEAYKYVIADAFDALNEMLPSREVLKARQIKPRTDAISGIEVQERQLSDGFSMILTYMLVPIVDRAKQKDKDVRDKERELGTLNASIKTKNEELLEMQKRKESIDKHIEFQAGEEARIKERKTAMEGKMSELEKDKDALLVEINELEVEKDKLKKKGKGDDDEEDEGEE
ncbi:MAG TPA: hypothetical protein VNF06_00825, partial [Candidatus Aquilonibacter sp.]|nr:hypothetical protein [Candidatus Aquilonibacter sp.]